MPNGGDRIVSFYNNGTTSLLGRVGLLTGTSIAMQTEFTLTNTFTASPSEARMRIANIDGRNRFAYMGQCTSSFNTAVVQTTTTSAQLVG